MSGDGTQVSDPARAILKALRHGKKYVSYDIFPLSESLSPG